MDTFLNIGITIVLSVVVIGVLVFIHELGHFLAAKKSGVFVQEFAFGFGKKLFSKKYNGTEYRINLLPFGGYVKMLGDLDASSLARIEAKEIIAENRDYVEKLFADNKIDLKTTRFDIVESFYEEQKLKLDQEHAEILEEYFVKYYIPRHPGNFENIPVKKKIAIITAGVIMNFLFGILLFYIYFALNSNYTDLRKIGNPNFIGAEVNNPPIVWFSYGTDNIGESIIVKADGKLVKNTDELKAIIADKYNKPTDLYIYSFAKNRYLETSIIFDGDGIKTNFDKDFLNKVLISGIEKDGVAEKAGLKEGLIITSINDEGINSIDKLKEVLSANRGKVVKVIYINLQGSSEEKMVALPQVEDGKPILGVSLIDTNNVVQDYTGLMRVSYDKNRLFSGVLHSVNMAGYNFSAMGELIKQSFAEKSIAPVSNSVSSVFAISDIFYTFVKWNNYLEVINISALISITLAIMNILPIPLFDGGHLLFIFLEKVRGKKMAMKTQDRIGQVFFYLLIGFSILVIVKDFVQFDWISRFFRFLGGLFS
jgi:regulator of sigma E protease